MTHAERLMRRKTMAEAMDEGVPIDEVCRRFSVCRLTVQIAQREFDAKRRRRKLLSLCRSMVPLRIAAEQVGIKYSKARNYCLIAGIKPVRVKPGIANRARWEALDWTLRDVDLARSVNVSRERIRQIRKKLGKTKSPDQGAMASAQFRRWVRMHSDQVAIETTKQLSVRFGISKTTVNSYLANVGLGSQRPQGSRWSKPVYLSQMINKENFQTFCRVDPDTDCWTIPGRETNRRHERIGKKSARHRVFTMFYGCVPPGSLILVKCRNRLCLNPAHLIIGTKGDMLRLRPYLPFPNRQSHAVTKSCL